MAEAADSVAPRFYVTSAHNPKTRAERYKRVHYYVSQLGISVSGLLKQRLLGLRKVSGQFEDPVIQTLAAKNYAENEFLPAVKELLCIWIHLDACDQAGDLMPEWLMGYLKLSLYASDYLLPDPNALGIMDLHSCCRDLESLCLEVTLKACQYLGYGKYSTQFVPSLISLLTESRPVRQKHLKDSLCLSLDQLLV